MVLTSFYLEDDYFGNLSPCGQAISLSDRASILVLVDWDRWLALRNSGSTNRRFYLYLKDSGLTAEERPVFLPLEDGLEADSLDKASQRKDSLLHAYGNAHEKPARTDAALLPLADGSVYIDR